MAKKDQNPVTPELEEMRRKIDAVDAQIQALISERAATTWTVSVTPPTRIDASTEADVVAGYEQLMAGRTTIVITHRPELARRADRIVTLAGGSIARPPSESALGAGVSSEPAVVVHA